MHPGYIDSEGRTYFRCTECGDSDNPKHAHAFVDKRGDTYCYRCNHVSHLTMQQFLYVQLDMCDLDEVISDDWKPFPLEPFFPTGRRNTLLTRYEGDHDIFAMRNARGRLVGYHHRKPNKVMLNEGDRGIDWPDSHNGTLLTSSKDNPLYLVEGPFDVINQQYVAAMGSISPTVMKHLKAQTVWAWPDPDVINTSIKRKKFVDMLNMANDNYCWVEGLIVSDADPDECKFKRKVTLKEANQFVRNEYALR